MHEGLIGKLEDSEVKDSRMHVRELSSIAKMKYGPSLKASVQTRRKREERQRDEKKLEKWLTPSRCKTDFGPDSRHSGAEDDSRPHLGEWREWEVNFERENDRRSISGVPANVTETSETLEQAAVDGVYKDKLTISEAEKTETIREI
ncbi:hypothetical protein PanWU01x14_023300 [Parasponia andersonii]|uniref:Uncharacterized protein n=1 Tax=Parasponia andersonii TaxID=3476 RepID=A0A2P5DXG6_PARAD|nr:hypothetical protein PanWU01x14_023300 [Parasponia andersonii]